MDDWFIQHNSKKTKKWSYLYCLDLFKEQRQLTIDEIMYKYKYLGYSFTRSQTRQHIFRLRLKGLVKNVGLGTYRLIKKSQDMK